MEGITKQSHKKRIKKLEALLEDIQTVFGHSSWLDRHAKPTRDNFSANFYYKTTTEIIRASMWTTWLLAKHEIEWYKREQPIK